MVVVRDREAAENPTDHGEEGDKVAPARCQPHCAVFIIVFVVALVLQHCRPYLDHCHGAKQTSAVQTVVYKLTWDIAQT